MKTKVLGADVEYEERGRGRTALLLHGNPDTHKIWNPLIERLKGKMRCVAPDLPGFGGSDIAAGFDFALERQASFVGGFLDSIEQKDPVDLIVHDVGGPYGLSWLVTQPERVRRLVICNSSFTRELHWHFWARVWRTPILGELTGYILNWPLFRREVRRGSRKLSDLQIRESYDAITPRSQKGVLAWYRKMDPEVFIGWDDKLHALVEKIPTLVLWGQHDAYIAPHLADQYGPKAKVIRFPNAGHWVQAEEPDGAAAAILEHLA